MFDDYLSQASWQILDSALHTVQFFIRCRNPRVILRRICLHTGNRIKQNNSKSRNRFKPCINRLGQLQVPFFCSLIKLPSSLSDEVFDTVGMLTRYVLERL